MGNNRAIFFLLFLSIFPFRNTQLEKREFIHIFYAYSRENMRALCVALSLKGNSIRVDGAIDNAF